MAAEFSPEARALADRAAAAIEAGDLDAAHRHLDAVADTSPTDRLILGVIAHATRQQKH